MYVIVFVVVVAAAAVVDVVSVVVVVVDVVVYFMLGCLSSCSLAYMQLAPSEAPGGTRSDMIGYDNNMI